MYTPVTPVLLYKSGVKGGQNYIGIFSLCSWNTEDCSLQDWSGSTLFFIQYKKPTDLDLHC